MNIDLINFSNLSDNESLIYLIESQEIPKLSSVALGNISIEDINSANLKKEYVIEFLMKNKPLLALISDTFLGRIGIILIPILYEEIYVDDKLIDALSDAIKLAKASGAVCASLTGLIPSATNYGNDIITSIKNLEDFKITTGHGATVSAMVLNAQNALKETNRFIENETVACIGVGAIGLATLKLLLSIQKHPKKIILSDVLYRSNHIKDVCQMIYKEFDYKGEIIVAESLDGVVPEIIYNESTLIIGATNVPDIIICGLLKPGTIIIDDSFPHIFNTESCLERFKNKKDILVLQGGKLSLPTSYKNTCSKVIEYLNSRRNVGQGNNKYAKEIMGCILGSILPVVSCNIPKTIGIVEPEASVLYYNFIVEKGIIASSLQCKNYYYTQEDIKDFIINTNKTII